MTRRLSVETSETMTSREYAASLLAEGIEKIKDLGWWDGKPEQKNGTVCAALSIDFSTNGDYEADHGMDGYDIAFKALVDEIPLVFEFKPSDIGDGHYTTTPESQRYAKVSVYNDAHDEATVLAWMERALARVKETNE